MNHLYAKDLINAFINLQMDDLTSDIRVLKTIFDFMFHKVYEAEIFIH